MRPVPCGALGQTIPVPRPGRFVVARLEEIGAARPRKRRVVDDERNVISGLFSGALPARADFRTVGIPEADAVIRRILGIRGFGRGEGEMALEEKRLNAAGEGRLIAGELTDLRHGNPPWLLGWEAGQWVAARQTKRPSPASSVQSGTARATIEVTGSGPK